MNLSFQLFLVKIKYTKDMDDIVSYIKENPDLERTKLNQLLRILREENATFHMLEVSKYAKNLALNDMIIIGCAISKNSSSLEIYEFLKAHVNIPELHNLLIKRLCALKNIDILTDLAIEFPELLKEYRLRVMNLIISESFISYLLEFASSAKPYLTKGEINNIINRVVAENKIRYILQAIEIFPENEKLIQAVLDTNNAEVIYEILKTNYERYTKYHKKFIHKLCILHDPKVLIQLYTEMNEVVNKYGVSSVVMKLIIKTAELKDIFIFIGNHKEVITNDIIDKLVDRVCEEQDPYFISLMSIKFPDFKTEKLAGALTLTNNAKFLFCFLKYNPSLPVEVVQAILFILIQTNDIKYMYRCLKECSNLQSTHRNQLLSKILENVNDIEIRKIIDEYNLLEGKGFATVSKYYNSKKLKKTKTEIRQYAKSA